MHLFVTRFQETMVLIKDSGVPQKKIWCGYSKSPQQRKRSGHAAWLKRAIRAAAPEKENLLDIEFSSGTVSLGEHRLASAALHPRPLTHEHLMTFRDLGVHAWVCVDLAAQQTEVILEDRR